MVDAVKTTLMVYQMYQLIYNNVIIMRASFNPGAGCFLFLFFVFSMDERIKPATSLIRY